MLWAIAGSIVGVACGFIPGMHPNNLLPLMASLPDPLCFTASLYVGYCFSSPFQAIFLGTSADATALLITPGQRLAAKSKGLMAFNGALNTVLLVILSAPLLFLVYSAIPEQVLKPLVGIVICTLFVFMLMGRGFIVTVLASCLGLLCADYNLLFPLLAGFFGASTILVSPKSVIPAQYSSEGLVHWNSVLLSHFSACLFALVPGASAGVSAAVARSIGRSNDELHVLTVAGINAAYLVFSIITLQLYGITRSGLAVFLKPFDILPLEVVGILFFSAGLSYVFSYYSGASLVRVLSRFSFVPYASLTVLVLMVLYFTGFLGMLVFFCSTSIGVLAVSLRVKRLNCMSAIILPVLLRLLL